MNDELKSTVTGISMPTQFEKYPKDQLPKLLDQLAGALGEKRFCEETATHIVTAIQPDRAVPKSLERFTPLISAGLESFLSCLSRKRLKEAVLELLSHDKDSEVGDRIFHLSLHFPTLHKLCQVIARRPDLDPDIKRWLVKLERGMYGTQPEPLINRIQEELSCRPEAQSITIEPEIMAEASVACVIPFTWSGSADGTNTQGVFKVLRPEVEKRLEEELQALTKTARFIEKNRNKFDLGNLQLSKLIDELSRDLRDEIDLAAEQKRLREAADLYVNETRVHIPAVFPFSSPHMTAMHYVDGVNVAEIDVAEEALMGVAELVFKSIICIPLFWKGDHALFHGDPHAGNIYLREDNSADRYDVVLLDWTLAGNLSRAQRLQIMQLLVGVLKNNSLDITRVIERLTDDRLDNGPASFQMILMAVEKLLNHQQWSSRDPLAKVFRLLEHTAMLGVAFPSELVLYRKAFFTLEGVLNDISPAFSMASSLEQYVQNLLFEELPYRSAAWFVTVGDDASGYRSMLSNFDLQSLILSRALNNWTKSMELYADMVGAAVNLTKDYFSFLLDLNQDRPQD